LCEKGDEDHERLLLHTGLYCLSSDCDLRESIVKFFRETSMAEIIASRQSDTRYLAQFSEFSAEV